MSYNNCTKKILFIYVFFLFVLQVNATDKYGQTALVDAVQAGHEEVVHTLIDYNVDVMACTLNDQRSVLFDAVHCGGGNYNIAGLLISYGGKQLIDKQGERRVVTGTITVTLSVTNCACFI